MLIFSKKDGKISKAFYEHHESVANCYENFEKFFGILFSENPDRNLLQSTKVAIDNCESVADKDLRQVVDVMGESFLPVTRVNLISLVQSTDEIANICQEVARQIYLEDIKIPAAMHHDVMEIIAITKRQLSILYSAVDKMLNDYKGISKDRSILDDIRTEEGNVDTIEAMLHERLFQIADLTLCEKIYYKDLLENICQISDVIEDIADQMQVMLVEREA